MQKSFLYGIAGVLALLMTGAGSCKKVKGIDNNTVVETPYALYYSDTAGQVFYTNDGKQMTRQVFHTDGFPCRSLILSGNNILFAKNNLYFSENNGVNFNHAYDSLRFRPDTAVNKLPINLNQTMLVNVPGSPDVVYTTSNIAHIPGVSPNYLGVAFNNNHGAPGNWTNDNGYDVNGVGIMPVKMVSFELMPNGTLCGLAIDLDGVHPRNLYLSTPTDISSSWKECTGNYLGVPNDSAGAPLPPKPGYADTCAFRLGHFNSRLIAIDMKGKQGAWYSDDQGRYWVKYAGLPANTPLLCVKAAFEHICLIGTDKGGLYMLNGNVGTWQQNNNGLGKNLTVRSITTKEQIYKNGTREQYVYLATDQGIYQSKDGGINWIKTIPGSYVTVY